MTSEMETGMWMMWFDDGKQPTTEKIAAAVDAYVRHFKTRPNTVRVSQDDKDAAVKGVTVYATNYVRPHNFWVGWEEASIRAQELREAAQP